MRRAAVSSAANIVEGCARHTKKDYLRFLDMAFASLRELGYYISLATRLGYLDRDHSKVLSGRHEEASRVLAGLIKSLRSAD